MLPSCKNKQEKKLVDKLYVFLRSDEKYYTRACLKIIKVDLFRKYDTSVNSFYKGE